MVSKHADVRHQPTAHDRAEPHPEILNIMKSAALAAAAGAVLAACAPVAWSASAVLNGVRIEIDDVTGTLTRLSHQATGDVLRAVRAESSILTVSSPVKEFPALQLEPRLSRATIADARGSITIAWDALSSNRNIVQASDGSVQARVTLRAAPDGKSVILSARVRNGSKRELTQILFPDLRGLRPFDAPHRMELRMALGAVNPFAGEVRPEGRARFYPHLLWQEYPAGQQYHRNALRWMDFGSLRGGWSLFERQWLTEPRPNLLTHRNEADPSDLRVAWQHRTRVRPGESWESEEYWLTPHRGGWAKGIETFRDYVRQVNPPREIAAPARIRDGLGFQTIWMSQGTEPDAAHAAFRFADLPRVARDAKAHGIDELVLWGWCTYGSLPIMSRAQLGTVEELLAGIRAAKELGVTVTPFVNVKNLNDVFAARYGLKPGNAASWVYHPEMIPAMAPFDTPSGQVDVPTDNPAWRKDATEALVDWAQRGVTSFAMDVFDDAGKMDLIDLTRDVRRKVQGYDRTASFAGEPTGGSFERATQVLDYTWNWMDYVEAGPYQNVLRFPRINVNAERSARVVKMAFADGLFINAMPKWPNQPNGSKLISEEPELAAALKQVAPLRRRFLEYFTQGNFLGEAVLAEPASAFVRHRSGSWIGGATIDVGDFEYPELFVRGHQLPERLLIVVLNNTATKRTVALTSDLSLWLPAAKRYRVVRYDGRGEVRGTVDWEPGTRWNAKVPDLQPLELAFFEIRAGA
jgi:hypothetical protein